ncbi:hydantoinase B/oxoprolinase family protein [Oscillatoria sp. CS-180]|uniref:hydantoinase B/oxoprolinase family protein n=1 Tax=Oscillatoria sp. CS-180 TaxID=3021720 RepID=UPI00232C2EE6|nr:hydantoinase B/oxoprolinase family protein [Oscillatoria sp. CS-180]MDB9528401.1 hydantoinase B/oxoprolinase family protein [Oscillatoria sp. CS-180]
MLKVFADRGGTFTDLVAVTDDANVAERLAEQSRFQVTPLPNHQWVIIYKLLSEQPERYQDAVIQGIRDILGLAPAAPMPSDEIEVVKMGTTVATNALLERQGDRTLLVTTRGFRDALRIGYQNRPNIFARKIELPEMLYEQVVEVAERYSAEGEVILPLSDDALADTQQHLQHAYDDGIRACAIVLMHGYRYPNHEQQIAAIARQIGFTQISVSHEVSPLMKFVSRGDTTVLDVYLSPILRRYVDQVEAALQPTAAAKLAPRLEFMKSDGGLTDARLFQGKDSILSGPAGGIVGAVKTSLRAGFDKIIGFDMGGTSTDVSHYNGEYERTFETEVAGVRLRAPMLSIHTVAAGGGSVLSFDGARYRVGPESGGADPGPACYRRGGPLTVTDCNVMLGKLQPEFFPQVFGPDGNQPLDTKVVRQAFIDQAATIATQTGDRRSPEQVAAGYLAIAIDKMASAIKKISVQRGYDVTEYTLCCFGGAGGQHACLIAEALGMKQIFLHPYAGVLSAYGIGLADIRNLREKAIEAELSAELLPQLEHTLEPLTVEGRAEVEHQGIATDAVEVIRKVHLRYVGTDSSLLVPFGTLTDMRSHFQKQHQQRYGFTRPDKALIVESLSVEVIGHTPALEEPQLAVRSTSLEPMAVTSFYSRDQWHQAPVYHRDDLRAGDRIMGPALIIEATGTNIIEPDWTATLTEQNHLILRQAQTTKAAPETKTLMATDAPDPVLLEIFNNLFQSIAEEMGITLQNTSHSVNIKERLDFSCALFDAAGQLVANAPHIPVHLGSMSESVHSLIAAQGDRLKPGDVYVSNNPYNGGTHLPDITAITPVFIDSERPIFYVASRGHHADIGGITPGSMPPHSSTIEEEGVLLDNVQLVDQGQFCEADILAQLTGGSYPVRNPHQNIADLQAQIAANERGSQELCRIATHYGLDVVQAYMHHVQSNATESVQRVIATLSNGKLTYAMDGGLSIQVAVALDRQQRTAHVDFTGTSPQQAGNLNAPLAIAKAVVLYVFRTLVDDDIPLNAGCLKPITLTVPEGCLLNPRYPAAVVAGNVETSQAIANALYGALGVMAASQGTMNNFTFGNERYQYYETICGGAGAGPDFDGADAVQTHMTNSRLTDPEVLEWRFPVLVDGFMIRPISGGNGHYRGGNGVIRCIQFREPMTAAILSGHRQVRPFGLRDGWRGSAGKNWIQRRDGTIEELDACAEVSMQPGDYFVIETPGGGGYGMSSRRYIDGMGEMLLH